MTHANKRESLTMAVAALVIAVATAAMCATWWWWRLHLLLSPVAWRLTAAVAVVAALVLLLVLHRTLGWPRSRHALVLAAGLAIGCSVGRLLTPDTGVGPRAPLEDRWSDHLLDVLDEQVSSGAIRGDFRGRVIAVVERDRLRFGAVRLRDAIISGRGHRFVIMVGGPLTDGVEETCRRAVRWLPKIREHDVTIVLVTPEPISDNTRQVLKDKGLKVIEVEHQFPDHL